MPKDFNKQFAERLFHSFIPRKVQDVIIKKMEEGDFKEEDVKELLEYFTIEDQVLNATWSDQKKNMIHYFVDKYSLKRK